MRILFRPTLGKAPVRLLKLARALGVRTISAWTGPASSVTRSTTVMFIPVPPISCSPP